MCNSQISVNKYMNSFKLKKCSKFSKLIVHQFIKQEISIKCANFLVYTRQHKNQTAANYLQNMGK